MSAMARSTAKSYPIDNRVRTIATVLLLFGVGVANAADWQIRPRVTVGATYTDNVTLARSGTTDETVIAQVTPGISIHGASTRVSADLDYNLQAVASLEGNGRDRINHQLQLSSAAELVPEHLFLDVSAAAFQALLDNELPYSNTNLNFLGNRTDVVQLRVRPSYRYRFGTLASFDASYGFSESYVGSGRVGDQRGQDLNLSLSSGSDFARLSWGLSYAYQRNEASGVSGNRNFEMAQAQGSIALTDQLRLNGSIGREVNSFRTNRPSGQKAIWSSGLTWMPTRRTTLTASFGERAWGRNYSLDLNHSHRRWTASIQYAEDYQTYLRVLQQTVLVPVVDEFGNPIVDPLRGVELLLPIDVPTLTDDIFLSRRWSATLAYTRRRDTFTFRGYRTDREFELSLQQDLLTGASGTWHHAFSRALSGNLNVSVQHSEFSNLPDADYLVYVSPSLSYRFGSRLTGNFSYRYYQRISDDTRRDYAENSITGTLTYLF